MAFRGWLAGLIAVALLLLGCPSNVCLLTVNGRCKWSTCPDGADFDTARKGCFCQRDRIALGGGCLTLDAANRYCGKGAHFERGGCAKNQCPKGLEIDQDTGTCTTPQQAAQVASNMGVQVGQNQKLGCPAGEVLVVEGQQAACVPQNATCGKDETWDGTTCKKATQCPPGSTFDPKANACVQFAAAQSGAKEYTVDLPTFLKTSFGPDGGDGAEGFCGGFNKHPLAFGVRSASSARIKVSVRVQVPGNQVSSAYPMTYAVVDATGRQVPEKGAVEVQQAAQATLASLVSGGGKSNVTDATTTVTCKVVNSSAPTAVTVTGGA